MPDAWSAPGVVRHYTAHRGALEQLYDSERVFLDQALLGARAVLDLGCAAGGFRAVLQQLAPAARYTGADRSAAMLAAARERFADARLVRIDGRRLPFAGGAFDTVVCFGVLHMTLDWPALLGEAWRVCRGRLLFDVRLVDGPGVADPARSYQPLAFDAGDPDPGRVPYVVLGSDRFRGTLDRLPGLAAIQGYGYWHAVSPQTRSPFDEVCMAVFCLTRGPAAAPAIDWRLPLAAEPVA